MSVQRTRIGKGLKHVVEDYPFVRAARQMNERLQALKDFGYELRMLLGADGIVKLIEQNDCESASDADKFGNIVNYFKDSVYLHSRNLLNALTNGYETEIGEISSDIDSELYGRIKLSLEFYVFHIKKIRDQLGVTNVPDGQQLSDYVHPLTDEVTRCWNEWIDLTTNAADEQKLKDWLADAIKKAQDDAARFQQLVKGLENV
jgi:hypothetical protein